MRFLYVMDPMERVLPDKDTTFAFQRAAQRRGHVALHCDARDLFIRDSLVGARCRGLGLLEGAPHFAFEAPTDILLRDVDAVFIRKDPPFNPGYLHATLMLEHARDQTFIFNDPKGLRTANEKLYTLQFSQHMPRTIVSSHKDQILDFVSASGGAAVIKPLDGAGGSGVLKLSTGDKNARAIIDIITAEGAQQAMVQEYLPAVVKGDKRILLLDGEIIGAINRVARADDLRSNIHVGGSVEPCDVTEKEREMVRSMAPRLRADGLMFVGLDMIDGRLTEINVTSPTGIQELSQHVGRDVADDVISWVERHCIKTATQPRS